MSQKKRVRPVEDMSDNESEPEMKRPRTAKEVLLFLDLGDRKGCPFPPRFFGKISERKWDVVDLQLDESADYEIAVKGDDGMECPLSRYNFKLVIKESEEPEEFNAMQEIITKKLKQYLVDIHFVFH